MFQHFPVVQKETRINMKKSKYSSKRKDRSRSPHEEKPKRSKYAPKSEEKPWNPEPPKVGPKKTRWEVQKMITGVKTTKTPVKPTQPIPEEKQEKAGPTLRIKDLLHDKEKMIDLLFQTVSGAALQKLIPDYLKNRPAEELKKLCLQQLNLMKNEDILQLISGRKLEAKTVKTGDANQIVPKSDLSKQVIPKEDPSKQVTSKLQDPSKQVTSKLQDPSKQDISKLQDPSKQAISKLEDPSKHIVSKLEDPKEKVDDVIFLLEKKVEESKIAENSPKNQELNSSVVEAENSSSDVIELHATAKERRFFRNQELNPSVVEAENSPSDAIVLHATAKEIESIDDDVAKVASLIKDEVSKTLNLPDRDAELLELEMRARAIRSLLKAKSQAPIDDSSTKEDEA